MIFLGAKFHGRQRPGIAVVWSVASLWPVSAMPPFPAFSTGQFTKDVPWFGRDSKDDPFGLTRTRHSAYQRTAENG